MKNKYAICLIFVKLEKGIVNIDSLMFQGKFKPPFKKDELTKTALNRPDCLVLVAKGYKFLMANHGVIKG